jgi:uncharacterized membrane protein YedE/YeeE
MEKTTSAYARSALFYAIVAAVFVAAGLTDWRGYGWVLVPAGAIFAASAWVQFSTGRRFARERKP